MLYEFQQRVYENKVRRKFNVTELWPELILMTEEMGELSEAILDNARDGVVDALGDILVYCLGLSAMFGWNADDLPREAVYKNNPHSWENFLPYISKSLGGISNTYKKSNKKPMADIDRQDEFKMHVSSLIGYCSDFLAFVGAKEDDILEQIILQNEKRTHEGYMPRSA